MTCVTMRGPVSFHGSQYHAFAFLSHIIPAYIYKDTEDNRANWVFVFRFSFLSLSNLVVASLCSIAVSNYLSLLCNFLNSYISFSSVILRTMERNRPMHVIEVGLTDNMIKEITDNVYCIYIAKLSNSLVC